MKQIVTAAVMILITACTSSRKETTIRYPDTKTADSADTYFGIRVPDPYRWLENDTAADVEHWVEQENKVTGEYLDRIPFRDKIRKEVTSHFNYARRSAPAKHGDYYYFYKNTGLQNQSVLYRTKDPSDTAAGEVFLDPNTFAEDGKVTLQGTSFTEDGSLLAYLISIGGSDWRDVIVRNTDDKQAVGDTMKNIKFSDVAWKGNGGFYYSTYDVPPGESRLTYKTIHHTLYYHELGTPQSEDRFVFGGEKEPHRYIGGAVTEDERYLVITAAETTTGNELYIQDLTKENAPVVPIVKGYDSEQDIVGNEGSTLYIYTNLNAPNYRLVKTNASDPAPGNWVNVIPETDEVLQVSFAGGYFFATYMEDVKNKVYQYDQSGKQIRGIGLPVAGTAEGFYGKRDQTDVYYTFTSFTYPSAIYRYNIQDGTSTLYWKPGLDFNPDDYVTRQVFYTSKDSTRIPMYIVYKKGVQLNGKNPAYLYGYGGFNISLMPSFSSTRMVWLNHGGIYAQPSLRGGGEYGKAWHMAGTRMHKQNVFDDFIAAAEYLVRENYTSSSYLAIAGGSNGGLLVGACMTQRPDLFKVALPSVGVLDMLRYNKFTAGAGWATDYGTAEDSPAMFQYLLAYSPLQHIKKGVRYPATLVWTADHDDRVVPAHSFKFAATLQAAQAGDNPVLIRIQHNAGHGTGMDTQKQINHITDHYAFTWYNMGVDPSE